MLIIFLKLGIDSVSKLPGLIFLFILRPEEVLRVVVPAKGSPVTAPVSEDEEAPFEENRNTKPSGSEL